MTTIRAEEILELCLQYPGQLGLAASAGGPPLAQWQQDLQNFVAAYHAGSANGAQPATPPQITAQVVGAYATLCKQVAPVTGATILASRNSLKSTWGLLAAAFFFLILCITSQVLVTYASLAPKPPAAVATSTTDSGIQAETAATTSDPASIKPAAVKPTPKTPRPYTLWDFGHDFALYFYTPVMGFLWGALGSCVYLLKRLSDLQADREFSTDLYKGSFTRIILGGTIAWVIVNIFDVTLIDSGGITVAALAFLAGLSVKIFYGALEKTVDVLAQKLNLSSLKRTAPPTLLAHITQKIGQVDPVKSPNLHAAMTNLLQELTTTNPTL